MAAKEEDDGKTAEAAPKSKKKLFIIIGAVAVLVIAGAAVFLLGGKKEEPKDKKEDEHHEEEPALHTFKLDAFVVNLAGGRQFLKVGMLVEYDQSLLPHKEVKEGEEAPAEGGHEAPAEGGTPDAPPAELAPRVPMMRDTVITLLTGKTAPDVTSPEGKETLKEELVDVLNDAVAMEDAPVVSVYFQEFIVQ